MNTQLEEQIPFRFHVGIRVSAEQSDPGRITELLGLEPHRISRKGEVSEAMEDLPERLRGVCARHHKWAASFEPLTLSESLNACLDRLATHLDAHSRPLAELAKDADITLYIYAYPGHSLDEPVDWMILESIRSGHPVGLDVNVYARHATDRPVDATRPKNNN